MSEDALDHPIKLEPAAGVVVVSVAGREIAKSRRAVVLREKGHEPVRYLPRGDVRMDLLTPSGTRTQCPHKGDASYFSVAGEGGVADVAWSYEDPKPGVGGIAGHLAFDPGKARIEG